MTQTNSLFTTKDLRFLIDTGSGQLEVMTRGGSENHPNWLVIACHPHPEHGGTMDNKVVTTVARAARETGLDSIRFNYRGVGKSSGSHGDFEGECEDLDSIRSWVRSETDKTRFILVGFSFGSAVAAVRANHIPECAHAVFIAPPAGRYPYPLNFNMPVSIIQGSEDEVVEADEVTEWVKAIESEYDYYYSGKTSHFFHGKLMPLKQKLSMIIQSAGCL